MKRSEAIKDIVKKSYAARTKALNEADQERGFSPDDNTAVGAPSPSGPASASGTTSQSTSGAGAGGGGGNSTRRVRTQPLTKARSKLKIGDRVLGLPSEIKKGRLDGLISAIAKNDEDAVIEMAADPDLSPLPIKETLPVELADLEEFPDPFIEEEEKEEFILKESIPEADFGGEKLLLPILINSDGGPQIICHPGDLKCQKAEDELEAYNEYEVEKANPGEAKDLKLVVQNNEALIGPAGGDWLK